MKTSRSVRRIAAVHDLSGVGRVSLTVVIPILSTMGFDVCPLPTAILSNHTQYENFTFLDLTDEMPAIIDHWEKLGVDFEAIYTGYLGSPRQIRIVADFIERFRTPDTLAARADVLTPNLTELFALLNEPFRSECTDDELKAAITELTSSGSGPDTVIITGVPVQGKPNLTSVIARSRTDGRTWKVTCPYLPAHYPGTGDAFTSVITGSLLQGDSLPIALDRAAQFILQGIRATFGYQTDNREGILLERVLQNLSLPIQSATYELV